MGHALTRLGYRVIGCRLDTVYALERGKVDDVVASVEDFDAVQDVPWAALYEQLDITFPGSKFILTVRDADAWLESARSHFGDTLIPLHGWLYGQARLLGNEKLYRQRYLEHNENVRTYFRARPCDFLELNLANDSGWERVCQFLGCRIPRRSFPHSNKAIHNQGVIERLPENLKRRLPFDLRRRLFNVKLRLRTAFGFKDPRDIFNNFEANRVEHARIRELNAKQDPRSRK